MKTLMCFVVIQLHLLQISIYVQRALHILWTYNLFTSLCYGELHILICPVQPAGVHFRCYTTLQLHQTIFHKRRSGRSQIKPGAAPYDHIYVSIVLPVMIYLPSQLTGNMRQFNNLLLIIYLMTSYFNNEIDKSSLLVPCRTFQLTGCHLLNLVRNDSMS